MARSIAPLVSLFSLCLLTAVPAAGQAAVEAGLGAGRAAIGTAPAKGIGKAMSGLADKLDKTVKASPNDPGGASAVTTVRMSPPAAKKPAVSNWEDPSGIQTGLSYADVVRRFGPPAIEITSEAGTSLTYAGKSGMVQLEVRDGKVASIDKPKS